MGKLCYFHMEPFLVARASQKIFFIRNEVKLVISSSMTLKLKDIS